MYLFFSVLPLGYRNIISKWITIDSCLELSSLFHIIIDSLHSTFSIFAFATVSLNTHFHQFDALEVLLRTFIFI
jgi:hypothetical protein